MVRVKGEMLMFKKNLKLLATMVGLVAVLVMILAMPGISQCGDYPHPIYPCINRGQLVQALQNAFAGLTASTEDLLDFEQAVFWSDGGPRQIVYIPPHTASGIWDMVRQLRSGEKVPDVPFGGLYVIEDATGLFKFKTPAAVKLRLRDGNRVVFINSEGEELMAIPAKLDLTTPIPQDLSKVIFTVEIRNNWCAKIKIICVAEIEVHSGEWRNVSKLNQPDVVP